MLNTSNDIGTISGKIIRNVVKPTPFIDEAFLHLCLLADSVTKTSMSKRVNRLDFENRGH